MKRLMRILLLVFCLFMLVNGLVMLWYSGVLFSAEKRLSPGSSAYFHTDPVLFFIMKVLFLK